MYENLVICTAVKFSKSNLRFLFPRDMINDSNSVFQKEFLGDLRWPNQAAQHAYILGCLSFEIR